ncbi:redoxin domain-containing protein [Myxococcota bacterium]|nr:redoxin domain-containing protein [Myxococcota bacterium]
MRLVRLCVALLGALALAACGGSSDGGNTNTEPRGAYPAGPYGTTEGAIIEPLEFLLPDGALRGLDDVWADESKELLLVVTSAGWCSGCIEEQPTLRRFHETYAPRGLAMIEALFEDAAFQPATKELAGSWQRQYSVPFDVVADPDFLLGNYYNRELTPMNLLVDVTKMEILRISTGSDPNALEAIFEARL